MKITVTAPSSNKAMKIGLLGQASPFLGTYRHGRAGNVSRGTVADGLTRFSTSTLRPPVGFLCAIRIRWVSSASAFIDESRGRVNVTPRENTLLVSIFCLIASGTFENHWSRGTNNSNQSIRYVFVLRDLSC